MMLRLTFSSAILFALAFAQTPGTNYQTGDGQIRQESIDQEGNVRGQYSYVDPNGKTITVKYTAGKDGFQVEGDHIPRAGDVSGAPASPNPPQFGGAPPQFPAGFNPQSLFAATPNSFGQPATPSQLAQFGQIPQASVQGQTGAFQFGQIPQAPIQGQAGAVQFSQIPSPSRFTPPLPVPQVGTQQQYSTAPAQFPAPPTQFTSAPQSANFPTFSFGQLQGNSQYSFPQLSTGQTPPQFPASAFSGIPASFNGPAQLSLQFPGTPQLSQFSSPSAGSQNTAQLTPAQFPSAPGSSLPPSAPQLSGTPAGTQFAEPRNPSFPASPHRFN